MTDERPGDDGEKPSDEAAVPREPDAAEQRAREVVAKGVEVLGQVGDPGPGSVGVGTLHHLPDGTQSGNHVVADPGDDLAGSVARRVEAVERVEHCGGVAAEKRQLLDEQRIGTAASRRDGRARSGGARPDDNNVAPDTDKPPSTHSTAAASTTVKSNPGPTPDTSGTTTPDPNNPNSNNAVGSRVSAQAPLGVTQSRAPSLIEALLRLAT